MFSKNLRYYRLKNNMTRAELAKKAGLSAMAITHYENGERKPNTEVLEKLEKALGISYEKLLIYRNENLKFIHKQFSCNKRLSKREISYIYEAVEMYFNDFYLVVDCLGGDILPNPLAANEIILHENNERCADLLRFFLKCSGSGPVGSITELLEDKGVLVCNLDVDFDGFFGMNGTVNGRPYIAINSRLSDEEKRMTLVHEMVHIFFYIAGDMSFSEAEKRADKIAAAFLLPQEDLLREVGIRRKFFASDMIKVCGKYGMSLKMFARRMYDCNVINYELMKELSSDYYNMNKHLEKCFSENPRMFKQLVIRAWGEEEISSSKAALMLGISLWDLRNSDLLAVI